MSQPRQYRPFRAALWAVYLVLAFTFSGLIIYSTIAWHLRENAVTAPLAELSDQQGCSRALGESYDQIHAQLAADERSMPRSEGWGHLQSRLHAVGVQCGLESSAGGDQAVAYRHLVHLERLCEAAATQYSQEVAPTDVAAVMALVRIGARGP